MTLEEARREALKYIRLGNENNRPDYVGGNQSGRMYDGAMFLLLGARDKGSPYWNLLAAIRRRMRVAHRGRPLMTERQRYKHGMMTDRDREWYEWKCRRRKADVMGETLRESERGLNR